MVTSVKPSFKDHKSLTLKKTYIQAIRKREKTVEGRLLKGAAKNIRVGNKVRFYYYSNAKDDVMCKVERVASFPNFRAMIAEMGFKRCIPEASSAEDAVNMYEKIYSTQQQTLFGVIAFELTLMNAE